MLREINLLYNLKMTVVQMHFMTKFDGYNGTYIIVRLTSSGRIFFNFQFIYSIFPFLFPSLSFFLSFLSLFLSTVSVNPLRADEDRISHFTKQRARSISGRKLKLHIFFT